MGVGVLIIDDDRSFRLIAEEALAREGYEVRTAGSAASARAAWQDALPDVVLLDRNLPDVDGVELLATLSAEARERGADTLFLVVTAYADVENAVHALRQGAEDYLTKPVQLSELVVKIRKAIEARRLRNRVRAFQRASSAPIDALLSSKSPAMREVLARASKVAQSPSTAVLLRGETGTGKEVLARLIHQETPQRREEALVALDCAAVSESLLESELFGHERGAFTDAKMGKPGVFELASGGTLFLDEVGELGAVLQAKLLRALETTTFRRVGGTRDITADVRFIAATNRDLEKEVASGRFRLDLFHRLDVFHLTLPPLRERREDIPDLARWLLDRIAQRTRRPPLRLSEEAEQVLIAYDYPGNVRELRNILERAVILESGTTLTADHLALGKARPPGSPAADFFTVPLLPDGRPPSLAEVERAYVERVLAHAKGNQSEASRILKISYPTVLKKITDYGIKVPR